MFIKQLSDNILHLGKGTCFFPSANVIRMPLSKKQYGENPPDVTEEPSLAIEKEQITMAEVNRALKNWQTGKVASFKNIPQNPGE